MRITAATGNAHKLSEMRALVKGFGLEIVSLEEAGLVGAEPEENGKSFEENSFIKADTVRRLSGGAAIADDSGLSVDILGGAPGIFSARYAGVHGDDGKNIALLLENLKGVPKEKRGAAFICVITLLFPDGKKIVSKGECRGHIAFAPRGEKGFGYDPVFIPEGYDETFAELGEGVKNKIGHRALALKALGKELHIEKD